MLLFRRKTRPDKAEQQNARQQGVVMAGHGFLLGQEKADTAAGYGRARERYALCGLRQSSLSEVLAISWVLVSLR